MRHYTHFSSTFWTRGSGRSLRGNPVAQLLAVYLMSCQNSNMIGLYYLPLVTTCAETGLTPEQVKATLPLISEIAQYDLSSELVWVPKAAKYQIGDTLSAKDKRRVAIKRELDMVSGHPFEREFLTLYGAAFGLDMPAPSTVQLKADKPLPVCEMPLPGSVQGALTVTATASVSDQGESEGGRASDVEPSDTDREMVIPLDLLDRAESAGVIREMAEWAAVSHAVMRVGAEEFMSYWTVGAGTGKRRSGWMRRLREHLRKLKTENRLPPEPGANGTTKAENSGYGSADEWY